MSASSRASPGRDVDVDRALVGADVLLVIRNAKHREQRRDDRESDGNEDVP
jgi:hypothetical protein